MPRFYIKAGDSELANSVAERLVSCFSNIDYAFVVGSIVGRLCIAAGNHVYARKVFARYISPLCQVYPWVKSELSEHTNLFLLWLTLN